jgi:hypothetical protein
MNEFKTNASVSRASNMIVNPMAALVDKLCLLFYNLMQTRSSYDTIQTVFLSSALTMPEKYRGECDSNVV